MKRGDRAKIIRSEAGNEGKIVTVCCQMENGDLNVKSDVALLHIRESDGQQRWRYWGYYPESWLELLP